MSATVIAVCVSHRSGLPRPTVAFGELRLDLGFVGNKHSVCGDRQVCLYSEKDYEDLRNEGASVGAGSFGENLVLAGMDFSSLKRGDKIHFENGAEIEITIPRKGCSNLKQIDPRLPELISGRAGWHAKVVTQGTITPGMSVTLSPLESA